MIEEIRNRQIENMRELIERVECAEKDNPDRLESMVDELVNAILALERQPYPDYAKANRALNRAIALSNEEYLH